MSESQVKAIAFTSGELSVTWGDGAVSRLDAVWLRDHCQQPSSRDPHNGQRLINVTDIPEDLQIASARVSDRGDIQIVFEPGSHSSTYNPKWLRDNCYCLNAAVDDRSASGKTLWSKADFPAGPPLIRFKDFYADRGKLKALETVADLGFVVLDEVPQRNRQVLEVIKQFGFVRQTNYGRHFEVRTEVSPSNLAYSNLGLGSHTDNPYRNPVPTVQLLHCLNSSVEGGETKLVDGFRAAEFLREESPEHFDLLVSHWIGFRYAHEQTDLRSRVPMIQVNDRAEVTGVRFNNRSTGTIQIDPDKMTAFYAAYRHFAQILERDELALEFKLEPGQLILFDNTRVMHGRRPFSAGGDRHLQGAYADLDGLYSTLYALRAKAG